MRMVVSDHLWSTASCRAVRIDKPLRVDLELRLRRQVDVGCGHDRFNTLAIAQQDAAALARVRCAGFRQQFIKRRTRDN